MEARLRDLERSTVEAAPQTASHGRSPQGHGFQVGSDGNSTHAWTAPHQNLEEEDDSPEIFGSRYTDAFEHATGGIGRVWRVIDSVLGREVALKEIRRDRVFPSTIAVRFMEEARITSLLEHPNIVPVHDLVARVGRPNFYTMRFLGDFTFSAAIRDYHRKSGKRGGFAEQAAAIAGVVRVGLQRDRVCSLQRGDPP